MKTYHTYSAVDVAFSLLRHAAEQGKCFTNLQLQKLTYISHGLSLANLKRPLIVDDVFAWQYGPVVPSVYLRFKEHGAQTIKETSDIVLDEDSEAIVGEVVSKLGHLSGPQLVELTYRSGSPWSQAWDSKRNKIIPDDVIEKHYSSIQTSGHTHSL